MQQAWSNIDSGLVTVGAASVVKAVTKVVACKSRSQSVYRLFESVLTEVLGAVDGHSEYMLCEPAECPNCGASITEYTLVRCEGEWEASTSTQSFGELGSTECDKTNIIFIDDTLLSEAQAFISGCEHCDPNAEMAFDYILDAVTQSEPTTTEYVMCRPPKCPCCHRDVTEKTLVVSRPSGCSDSTIPDYQ